MRKSITKLFLAALSLLCISGCAGRDVREPEQEIIIGVVTKSRNSEYWMCHGEGCQREEREDSRIPQDLLKMQVDALAVSPLILTIISIAMPWPWGCEGPCFATPPPSGVWPSIGIDNETVGYELAECWLIRWSTRGTLPSLRAAGSRHP